MIEQVGRTLGLGCAFHRDSAELRQNLAKSHRQEKMRKLEAPECTTILYLSHSGPFRLVLVYEVPTGRKCTYLL